MWTESYLPLLTDPNFDVRGAALVEYLDQHPPPWRKEQFGVPTLYNVAELHIRCRNNSWWFQKVLGDDIDFLGFQVLGWMPNGESISLSYHSKYRTKPRCLCKLFLCNQGCPRHVNAYAPVYACHLNLLNFGLAQQSWIAHDHSDSDQSNLLSLQSSELLLCFRDMFSKQGFVHECAMLLKTSIESPWMISLPVWLQCWARSSEVRRMYVEADCIDEMPSLEDKVVIGQPTTSFWGVVYMVAW